LGGRGAGPARGGFAGFAPGGVAGWGLVRWGHSGRGAGPRRRAGGGPGGRRRPRVAGTARANGSPVSAAA
jgi:hypothetical protein